MKGYIYLIENKINGKKYIGKTYSSIEKRWKEHIKDRIRFDRPLYRAMNKYGIENFSIQELEYCENLEEREIYWISFYDSYHNGYNATLGGDGKLYFEYTDEEVIEYYLKTKSVRDTALFFKCDVETIRKRLKNNNIDIPKGGNIYSSKRLWKTREICQYSLNGEFIQTFPSQSEAARWLISNGYSKGQEKHIVSNISKNIRNIENRKQAYGFIWKYKEEN